MYLFVTHYRACTPKGGFDGRSRVADLYGFNTNSRIWQAIIPIAGSPPSPRHSHSAVVYQSSMYVYGKYFSSSLSSLIIARCNQSYSVSKRPFTYLFRRTFSLYIPRRLRWGLSVSVDVVFQYVIEIEQ